VQKFVKRSIRGGFTMIFNKTNLKGPDDYTFYVDFTSLYPTIMSKCELPYKFKEWLDIENKSVQEVLDHCKNNENLYYFIDCDIAPLEEKYQDKVSNYPMFPETQTIKAEDYSKDQQYRSMKNNKTDSFSDQTLNTVSFYGKKNYISSWSYSKNGTIGWI
jgi:hypothetical protein